MKHILLIYHFFHPDTVIVRDYFRIWQKSWFVPGTRSRYLPETV